MTTGQITDHPTLRTQVKKLWQDPWTELQNVEPLNITLTTAPTISTAEVLYRSGQIMREAGTDFADEAPLADYKDWFVRIQMQTQDPPPDDWLTLFYGIIGQEDVTVHPGQSTGPQTADQVVVCFGLELLLSRKPQRTSLIRTGNGASEFTIINDVLTFNEAVSYGRTAIGNRSTSKKQLFPWGQPQTFYVFDNAQLSGTSADRVAWTALDIIEYMLLTSEAFEVQWKITGQTEGLDEIVPRAWRPVARTVADALEAFADRRRGLGWLVRVDETATPNIAELFIYSVFDQALNIGGTVIPANPNQNVIDLDDRHDLEAPLQVLHDGLTRYDAIHVRGGRTWSMFTLSYDDGTLQNYWIPGDETAYENADDKQRGEDGLNHVYVTHGTASNWNWLVHASAGPAYEASPFINPADATVDHDKSAEFRNFDHRLSRQLPVLDAFGDHQRPFVVYERDGTYYQADNPDPDVSPKAGLATLDAWIGFRLTPAGLPHLFGLNTFNGDTKQPAEADYNTIHATVAIETDEVLRVELQITGGLLPNTGRILQIDVPDAELWYRVRNTVTGIDDAGALVRSGTSTADTILRDDGPRLLAIAQLAAEWYKRTRQAARLVLTGIVDAYPVGSLLEFQTAAWTRETVGSPVTAVVYQLRENTTTIVTDYAVPDFTAFF